MRYALILVLLAIGCGGKVEALDHTQGSGGASGHPAGGSGGIAGSGGVSAGGSAGVGGAAGSGGTVNDPCSLQLVQPGAAADWPSTTQSTPPRLTPPVAVATPSAFLSIYREAGDKQSFIVVQGIDDQGVAISTQTMPDPGCPSDLSGGITAAWNDLANKGLLAIAWPACGGSTSPGILFAEFDAYGVIGNTMVPPVVAYEIRLQPQGGAVPAPNDISFILATVTLSPGPYPTFYQVTGLNAVFAPNFPTLTNDSWDVALAATSGIISFFTTGPKETSWYVGPPNSPFVVTSLPSSKVGRVAALGDRAMAMIPTSEGMRWWLRTADGTELQKGTIAGNGYPAALIAVEDHFLAAASFHDAVTLHRFDHASGAMGTEPSLKVTLPQTMGNTSLSAFESESLSMAAARGRVLVTWSNGLGAPPLGTPLGGYALLKCAAQ